MKKGLFILHEGIGSTIFNSQIVEHTKEMESNSVKIDILSYETISKHWSISLKNYCSIRNAYPEINIKLKRAINQYLPFNYIWNITLLYVFLRKNIKKYDFIHARANYTAFLCVILKKILNLKVIWDCRGDSLSELKDSVSTKNFLIKLYAKIILIPLEKYQINFLCKNADSAIFVSDSLFKLYQNKIKFHDYRIIPCLVNEKMFFYDEQLRLDTREKCGFDLNSNIFIYSGSMIGYQSVELQKSFFARLLAFEKNVVLYLTSDVNYATLFFNNFPNDRFIIHRASFSEMNEYYNAADFAILLRDDKLLNNVSSPTKFGEYCLCGLKVIMNDTVAQAYEYSNILGNYLSYTSTQYIKSSNEERRKIAIKAKELYSRRFLINNYLDLYE